MADPTPVASVATSVPTPADIARAEKFTREAFVHTGETTEDALGRGTARRRALDAALLEIDAGAKVPSPEWRRRYSLMLGLERVLSDDEPKLADGTSLNPHQVDALSGTLTALLAEAQRNGGTPLVASAAPVLALDDEPEEYADEPEAVVEDDDELNGDEDDDDDDEPEDLSPLDIEIDIGDDDEDEDEEEPDEDAPEGPLDEDQLEEAPDDPNAHKRFWFEHATGAGKTVAAMGFVDASRTGGVLILTHRRNLVDQFHGELKDRGYAKRITPALLQGQDNANGPVTVETYQWFVRNAGKISEAYSIVICDEAHTALGEKTSASIRKWTGPIFIGMTATGALIARHVTDLFPTQTSRFDLAQAARRGVISPLRCVRIPPGPGVRTIAKVPLRRGEVDVEFDQEMLAELLDQAPFNFAAADLYKTRFNGVPGVVYAAGVKHAYNLAAAFREQGMKAMAVSGETRKRELAEILANYERGEIDVLINAQLLAEGWNSPRATVCMHLAPTASKRIYQQRVGRVTRRNPGKEAGIVVDFVAPDTKNDDAVVTLHSLLDRDVYRGGAIVVGPVRRGRGRRLRVERRVLPVTSDEDRRIEVFERELWRIAVEHLPYGEQIQWAALAGARVAPSGWRRARAMLHFDREGAIKRAFLLTAVQRNKNPQLRVRALQEIASSRDGEAFDSAIDEIGGWTREERREGTKVMLLALAEKRIGRRDQANAWIWRLASYTREVHEEYAVQRWPETKRLLGLLVNSSGAAHARNARRLVHAARKQDRRLSAALLAAAIAHTPEGEEILRGARTRLARKPSALSRELLRNFPKSRGRRGSRRRRKKGGAEDGQVVAQISGEASTFEGTIDSDRDAAPPTRSSSRRSRSRNGRAARAAAAAAEGGGQSGDRSSGGGQSGERSPGSGQSGERSPGSRRSRARNGRAAGDAGAPNVTPEVAAAAAAEPTPSTSAEDEARAVEAIAGAAAALAAVHGPKAPGDEETDTRSRSRARRRKAAPPVPPEAKVAPEAADAGEVGDPKPRARRAAAKPVAGQDTAGVAAPTEAADAAKPKPRARRSTAKPAVAEDPAAAASPAEAADAAPSKSRARRATAKPAAAEDSARAASPADSGAEPTPKPRARRSTAKPAAADDPAGAASPAEPGAEAKPKPRARRSTGKPAAADDSARAASPAGGGEGPTPKPRARRSAAKPVAAEDPVGAASAAESGEVAKPKPRARRATAKSVEGGANAVVAEDSSGTAAPANARTTAKPQPHARRATAKPAAAEDPTGAGSPDGPGEGPKRQPRARRAAAKPAAADAKAASVPAEGGDAPKPKPRARHSVAKAAASEDGTAAATAAGEDTPKPKPRARRTPAKPAA